MIDIVKVKERLDRVLASGFPIEAAKTQRAWSGKINHIDKLLSWMYDKGILNKSEKNRKDTLFRSYYRYYNDGDFPRILTNKGIDKYSSKDQIEQALEEEVEDFIKSILSKYSGKYSRTDFRYDQYTKQLDDVIKFLKEQDFGSADYFFKKIPNSDEELVRLHNELKNAEKDFRTKVSKVEQDPDVKKHLKKQYYNSLNGVSVSYIKTLLGKYWNKELQSSYNKLLNVASEMRLKLEQIREAADRLKREGLF